MILGINPHQPNMDPEGEVSFYTATDDPVTKILRIVSLENGDFNLMYAGLQNETDLINKMEIRLKRGQFVVI